MPLTQRYISALRAAGIHLVISLGVVVLAAALVFLLWYPSPFDELAGGRNLIFMIGIIDLVMGPVLTLVIFDPAKPKPALARDIGAITLMQVAALIYGLNTAFEARPVWLAFEADAFRLVTAADIPKADLTNAPEGMRQLSWRGPLPVGVPSLTPNDPGYLLSIEQSIAGFHSAFRPARWVAYSTQIEHVKKQAKPLSELSRKNSFHAEIITRTIKQLGVNESELAYLPLITREQNDWVVIINKIDGRPLTTLPMDGW